MSNSLDHYSIEELEAMKAQYGEQDNSSAENESDYSQQYKRGISDWGRDLAYGALKPIQEGIHKIPGYEASQKLMQQHGMNQPELDLEKLKSPYPSPTGNALQFMGGFLIPGGMAQKEFNIASKVASKIPKFTQKGAGKGFTKYETLAEKANPNIKIDPKLNEEIKKFLEQRQYPTEGIFERAETGHYKPHFDIQKTLGDFERQGADVATRSGAKDLRREYLRQHNKSLDNQGMGHLSKALQEAQEGYAKHKKFIKKLKVGGSLLGAEEAVRRLLFKH